MSRKLQPSTLRRKAKAAEKAKAQKLTPEAVFLELTKQSITLEKEICERSLYEFVKRAWHVVEPEKEFYQGWHIAAICQHLEAVSRGQLRNLIINIPPGCMKSLLVCVFWPCWEWIQNGTGRWLYSSYDLALSNRDSTRCRSLLQSPWYQSKWPMGLKDDQNQKIYYENDRGGWRMATTVGGRATGHHPSAKVGDDVHNVKKAESEVERQAVIDWWDGTMSTRGMLSDPASVIVMQRLNSQDLSAHLIAKGTFDLLCFPMRYEPDHPTPVKSSLGFRDPRTTPGELLWPEVLPEHKVRELEVKMGEYFTAGQFQQRPHPRGGGMFKLEWFSSILAIVPTDVLKWVRYWDKAGSEGGSGARTAGVLIGKRRNGRFVIADVVKGRWLSADREAVIKATAQRDLMRYGSGVEVWVEQEPGSGGKESAENTVKNLAGLSCKIERVTGPKEVRAEPFAAQCSVQNVDLVLAEWNQEFIDECCSFPAGKLKDQVDAAGGGFNKLSAGTGAFAPGQLTAPGGSGNNDAVEFTRIEAGGSDFF